MLRRFALVAMLIAAALTPQASFAFGYRTEAVAAVPSGQMPMFDTESAAQVHCPADVVVWLNTKSGIWHEKGMRWYGRTKHGAYVCRKEAAAAGYRDTRNGQ